MTSRLTMLFSIVREISVADTAWSLLQGSRPRSVRRQTTTVKSLTMLNGLNLHESLPTV